MTVRRVCFLLVTSSFVPLEARSGGFLRVRDFFGEQRVNTGVDVATEPATNQPLDGELVGQVDDIMEDLEAERGMQCDTSVAVATDTETRPAPMTPQRKPAKKQRGVYNYMTGEFKPEVLIQTHAMHDDKRTDLHGDALGQHVTATAVGANTQTRKKHDDNDAKIDGDALEQDVNVAVATASTELDKSSGMGGETVEEDGNAIVPSNEVDISHGELNGDSVKEDTNASISSGSTSNDNFDQARGTQLAADMSALVDTVHAGEGANDESTEADESNGEAQGTDDAAEESEEETADEESAEADESNEEAQGTDDGAEESKEETADEDMAEADESNGEAQGTDDAAEESKDETADEDGAEADE